MPLTARARARKNHGRGPKKDGRGTAPNVRAWGARQCAVGATMIYALIVQQQVAFTCATVAVFARVTGDVIQNVLDGCYWKLAIFVPVEGIFCFLIIYSSYIA